MRAATTRCHRWRTSEGAALLAGLVLAIITGVGCGDTSTDDGTRSTRPAIRPVAGATVAEVVKIVDGDTIDVRTRDGEMRVRLYGVDTPERGDRCFREATERTRALAASQVQLLPDARRRDSFKRELRYVYTAGGESIDAALVRGGFARAWREDGAQRAALIALEEGARAAKTGCLWSTS